MTSLVVDVLTNLTDWLLASAIVGGVVATFGWALGSERRR